VSRHPTPPGAVGAASHHLSGATSRRPGYLGIERPIRSAEVAGGRENARATAAGRATPR
jgi:hypothetical protein